AICEQASTLAGNPEGLVSDPESCQLVVHVDVGLLTGEDPKGRCHLEDGTPISAAVAHRLGCDAQVVAITERDGLPIDVGPARRPRRAARAGGRGPAPPPPPPPRGGGGRLGPPPPPPPPRGGWAPPPTWLMASPCPPPPIRGCMTATIESWAAQTVSCASRP